MAAQALKSYYLGEDRSQGIEVERDIIVANGNTKPGVYVNLSMGLFGYGTADRLVNPERDLPKLEEEGIAVDLVVE